MLEKGDIKIEDGEVLEFNDSDWVKADLDEDDKKDFIERANKWINGGKDNFLKRQENFFKKDLEVKERIEKNKSKEKELKEKYNNPIAEGFCSIAFIVGLFYLILKAFKYLIIFILHF